MVIWKREKKNAVPEPVEDCRRHALSLPKARPEPVEGEPVEGELVEGTP